VSRIEQAAPRERQVRVPGVALHDCKNRRMIRQAVLDGEEDSGAVEPETADDRHEVRQVGNLMADSSQEAGETDVEYGLQDDHGDDENDSPSDYLRRGDDRYEENHDDDSRNEVEEIPHDDRDRQSRARELEALDHRSSGPDSPGAARHRLSGELEEEYTDHQKAEEV